MCYRKLNIRFHSRNLNAGNIQIQRLRLLCTPVVSALDYPNRYCTVLSRFALYAFIYNLITKQKKGVQIVHLLEEYSSVMKSFPYPYVLVVPHPELEPGVGAGNIIRVLTRDAE